MNSKDIRKAFLDHFENQQHKLVSSAPIVIKNDPTLMFTNAGMNQFKDIFLGDEEPTNTRVANSQKCLRVSGKHNDLEEVGVDTYHHTMFEMLGNWSFGDYFKKEAIQMSWDFLTKVLKLDTSRIYITVFEGDKKDGLDADTEAIEYWKEWIGNDRILKFDKKDNFWEMGATGPCGPCSEIHYDNRNNDERKEVDGASLVNKDHEQVIEIWNLVFMQYNRSANGSLTPLSMQHIDTGMGLERLVRVVQNKQSNYDTDIFIPLIKQIEKHCNFTYQPKNKDTNQVKQNIAFRVIADHIRAITFSIADGQMPSNTGAGYVIRRILRRAIRYAYQSLNIQSAFIYQLVDTLNEQMGDYFEELRKHKDFIKNVIQQEEITFYNTLDKGLKILDNLIKTEKNISGKNAFLLYDTYGFPFDLTKLIAHEQGVNVDKNAFEEALKEQKNRSKSDAETNKSDWLVIAEDDVEEFIGYDHTEAQVHITRYREIETKGKKLYHIILNYTPFYPEGGGQVGDTGILKSNEETIKIVDTQKENKLIIHITPDIPKNPRIAFRAIVDSNKRENTSKNHSATHLLHKALRDVLGTHVEQKGSLVNSKYLRFDFSHFAKVEDEDLLKIENQVNTNIRKAIELTEKRQIPLYEAQEMGAMMLFGEKYGDTVRLIQFEDSIELCGGIHVKNTAQIGFFKILKESSIASGIRRIEAITGLEADNYISNQIHTIKNLEAKLKSNNIDKSIDDLLNENSKLKKELEALKNEKSAGLKKDIISSLQEKNNFKYSILKTNIDNASIKNILFQIKKEVDNIFIFLVNQDNNKVSLNLIISDALAQEKEWHAGNIIKSLAKLINGGGGGQAFFATAGGSKPEGIEAVIEEAEKIVLN